MSKIKVFIGTEPKTEIARKVLQHSILKHTKKEIEFYPLMGEGWVLRPALGLGTGFSILRWDIPRLCNYEGYAIYLDADQLVFSDINDLWRSDINYPNKGCSVWCTYQKSKWFKFETPETSVMFMDCEKSRFNQKNLEEIKKHLEGDKDRKRYVQIMRGLNHLITPQEIGKSWNHLNDYHINKTRLLHYTKEPEQPWYNPKHPHKDLWEEALKETIDAGEITKKELLEAIISFTPHEKGKRGFGLHPHYKYLTI